MLPSECNNAQFQAFPPLVPSEIIHFASIKSSRTLRTSKQACLLIYTLPCRQSLPTAKPQTLTEHRIHLIQISNHSCTCASNKLQNPHRASNPSNSNFKPLKHLCKHQVAKPSPRHQEFSRGSGKRGLLNRNVQKALLGGGITSQQVLQHRRSPARGQCERRHINPEGKIFGSGIAGKQVLQHRRSPARRQCERSVQCERTHINI